MKQTTDTKQWTCPHCRADLAKDGVSEVTEGLNRWTVWRRHDDRWEFFDEDDQDDYQRWYLKCRSCVRRLPEPLANDIWEEVQASW